MDSVEVDRKGSRMTIDQAAHVAKAPEVLVLLQRQAELFDALGDLSRSQRGAIEQGPADAVLSLLARRQQILEQLTGVATELEPYRVAWPATLESLDAAQREEADRLVAWSERHLEAILDRDDEDRTLLQKARDEAGEQLSQINRSGQALHAYGATPSVDTNRYTDRCG